MGYWDKAGSVADLGRLTADWLEGRISHFDHEISLDPETTTGMIRTLAAINRAGFVTVSSQPGFDGPGFDGARWRQRAAASGFVSDPALLGTMRDAARRTGLHMVVDAPGVAVTDRAGVPCTWFGGMLPRGDLRREWRGVGRPALAELQIAHQVAVIDPTWGPSDRLWTVLDQIARRYA